MLGNGQAHASSNERIRWFFVSSSPSEPTPADLVVVQEALRGEELVRFQPSHADVGALEGLSRGRHEPSVRLRDERRSGRPSPHGSRAMEDPIDPSAADAARERPSRVSSRTGSSSWVEYVRAKLLFRMPKTHGNASQASMTVEVPALDPLRSV